ncbi:hypothetical protein JCM10213_004043 [Rhodosporidiobolus nylandii]
MATHALDDPFVLPFTLPGASCRPPSSSSSSSTVTSTHPPSFLLASTLPPSRPLLPHSHSYACKENALADPSSSASAAKHGKPRSVRRVFFSPTPLPSLEASPKHKRPYAAFLCGSPGQGGEGRSAKRRRNVYSGNPLLEALRREELDGECSPGSDASTVSSAGSDGGDKSSPPTSTTASPAAALLPPLRTSALRVSSCAAPSPPAQLRFPSLSATAALQPSFTPPQPLRPLSSLTSSSSASASAIPSARGPSDLVMPFSLPGMKPQLLAPLPAPIAEQDADETDSETESEVVSSLLLPSQPSLLPSLSFAPSSSSSSSSLASSSPLPSPSRAPRRPSLRPTLSAPANLAGLKSILKPLAPNASGVGATVKNEREGLKRNGRGRRHTTGWEDCRAGAAVDAGEASGSKPSASSASRRAGAGSSRRAGTGANSAPPSSSSASLLPNGGGGSSSGGGNTPQPVNSGARITYAVQPGDSILLRTPLLTLQASLRAASAAYVRQGEDGPLLARAAGLQEASAGEASFFETPTFLPDIEEAYTMLYRAIFQLPSPAALPAGSAELARALEPLREFRTPLLAALKRDIGNIASFPSWVATQPALASPSSSSRSSSPTSSPGSSPSRPANGSGKGKAKGQGKSSLTEEQMRRMRDELGAAQAALKCVAAVVRSERVSAVFEDDDLPSLLRLIGTIPLAAPTLSPLVQKDLFPFIPFVFSSLSLPPSTISSLMPSLLPALNACLTLPPRVDRYRLSVAESLNALSHLVTLAPRAALSGGAWKIWFKSAVLGLWDGPKKGTSTRERAVRLVGRIVRALTVEVGEGEGEEEWVREREKCQKDVGKEMLAILYDSPTDAQVDPETEKPVTYRKLLFDQFSGAAGSPSAANGGEEAAVLHNLTLLSLLPALLGPSFRKLDDKGIGPWIHPFNTLIHSSSPHVLALSALSWSHLVYAFLRTTSDKSGAGSAWAFRKPDARPFGLLTGLFTNRAKHAWRRADVADPTGAVPGRKENQRLHARALGLALTALTYGATVYIRHGVSPVRAALPPAANDGEKQREVDGPLSSRQLEHLDIVFDKLVAVSCPLAAHTGVSQDAPALAWQILSAVVRPRTDNDATTATLEALVNPAFLNGSLGQLAPGGREVDKDKQALLTARAMAAAVQPARIPGWGSEWVATRVEKVLEVFAKCLPEDGEKTVEQVVEPHYTVAWQNLLRTLALTSASSPTPPSALVTALSSLADLSCPPTVSAALWSAGLALGEEKIIQAVEEVLKGKPDAIEKATAAWLRLGEKSAVYAEVLARSWTSAIEANSPTLSPSQLGAIISLLHHLADSSVLSVTGDSINLATCIKSALERDDATSHTLLAILSTAVAAPADAASSLRLCALLVSASHEGSLEAQENVLALSFHAVKHLLRTEEVEKDGIELIAKVLEAASDEAFPSLYAFVLEVLAGVISHSTSAVLQHLSPLLAPSINRAVNLTLKNLPAESQFESQAALQQSLVSHSYAGHPSHRPYLAFADFWRATFGKAKEDLQYPPELVEPLVMMKELAEDFPVPNLGDSQESSVEELAAAQVASSRSRTLPRTTASTGLDISSRSYDADHSHLPRESLRTSSVDDASFTAPISGMRGGHRVPSPSLYAIERGELPSSSAAGADGDDAMAVEPAQTQEVEETPVRVEKMRGRASLASMASSAVEQPVQEKKERRRSSRTSSKGQGETVPEKAPAKEKKRKHIDEITIEDSEDEIVVAAPPKKPSPPPCKKGKTRRSASSSSLSSAAAEPAPVPEASTSVAASNPKPSSSKKRASPPVVDFEVSIPARKKRKSPTTRAKVKKSSATPSPPVQRQPSASPALNSRSASPELSPTTAAIRADEEETARRFFALPLDTAYQLGRQLGRPSLQRLMLLGERAKEYFERLSQSSSSP